MGMAASQARYIALTARKSNIEYEGQQINQARTALANQTANLFNQMMGMGVPAPPEISDFMTIQYSFSDGVNNEVLSNYYQLGTADSDYNYVVTTYHNEKVYTGSRKKMNDPQIQANTINHFSYNPDSTDNNTSKSVTKAVANADGTYLIQATDNSTKIFRPAALKDEDQVKAINLANGEKETEIIDLTGAGATDAFTGVKQTDTELINQIAKLYNIADPTTIADDAYYTDGNGGFILKADYDTPTANVTLTRAKGLDAADPQTYYTDGNTFITKANLDAAVAKYDTFVETGKKELNEVNYINVSNDPEFNNYTYVGNSALTELKESDLEDEDVNAAIMQIMKDMQASNGDKVGAQNFAACFDTDPVDGSLIYKGGIYTFQMAGQTYYTTKNDLDASLGTSLVDNDIDVQQEKFAYYNATYLETKVEETQKALLETDGNGRFKTVKFENDSVVYALNTEQVTDDDAYNDAMNRYYYENAMYEKAIADINAKTETIQAQDRTLELRMEQLGTEQSALQNEMEAVKKVVDKHIELGFKTFGG